MYDQFKRLFDDNYEVDHVPLNLDDLLLAYIETNEFVHDSTRYKVDESVRIEDLADKQMVMVTGTFFEQKWKVQSAIYRWA